MSTQNQQDERDEHVGNQPRSGSVKSFRDSDNSRRRPARGENKSNGDLRAGLLPLRVVGSLTFGIAIMSMLIVLLAWGTLVESEYGRNVSRFALYGSRWFAVLLAVFALNVACSMLLRFPWKKHHLPFLAAHAGILLLLLGSYRTWTRGQEAMVVLPEGTATNYAVKTDQQLFEIQNTSLMSRGGKTETATIAFEPGPFNWEDYDRKKFRSDHQAFRETLWLAMQWGRRDQGLLAMSDKTSESLKSVKIEVLDYLACSTTQRCPPLDLNVLWKRPIRTETDLGEIRETPRNWERVKLDIKAQSHPGRLEIRGTRSEQIGGERICFFVTTGMTEVDAFRSSVFDDVSETDDVGRDDPWGRIVLYYNGRNHLVNVGRLLEETAGEKRVPLKGTGFEIGNVRFRPRGPILQFALYAPSGEQEFMTLYPDIPDMNVQAPVFGVYGTYRINPERLNEAHSDQIAETTLDRLAKPRLEILQGPDRRLYYRYWNGKQFLAAGLIPNAGETAAKTRTAGTKPSLTLAHDTPDEVQLVVEQFIPHDLPGWRIVSQPVGRNVGNDQRVKLRVSMDGKEDTFWLRPTQVPPERDQVRFIHGNGRTVRIVWDHVRIPLGFGIFLKRFEKRTEPGTRTASHYSSLVDFVEMPDRGPEQALSRSPGDFRILEEDILIRMNQPAVFHGNNDRRFRIYQSAFDGPFHPGDFYFKDLYDGRIFPWESRPRESIFVSKLSVNDDPGRGLKYLGSFFLVLGTAWFFYRKR